MEVASMEVEDDLFFADLSKQISLLIMDDDDDPIGHSSPVSLQAFSSQSFRLTSVPPAQTCLRESKGTGVFIPRSSLPRRKNRSTQGRSNSFNPNSYKQQEKSRNVISNMKYNNDPSCNCYYNSKKY